MTASTALSTGERIYKLIRTRQKGFTATEIADRLKVTVATVRKYLKEFVADFSVTRVRRARSIYYVVSGQTNN